MTGLAEMTPVADKTDQELHRELAGGTHRADAIRAEFERREEWRRRHTPLMIGFRGGAAR